jgi:hypothetical protein
MTTDPNRPHLPEDAALLARVARVWELADPPPADLAAGVLARLAAEDLEFDLLTLVDSDDLAGVRHAAPERDETGSWSLEYAGPDFRAYVRATRIEDRTRLDGWVVPARAMTVQLRTEGREAPLEAALDEFGRFEFSHTDPGLHRLSFLDIDPSPGQPAGRPRITPPFWI